MVRGYRGTPRSHGKYPASGYDVVGIALGTITVLGFGWQMFYYARGHRAGPWYGAVEGVKAFASASVVFSSKVAVNCRWYSGWRDVRLQRVSTVCRNFRAPYDAKVLGRKTFDVSVKMGASFSAKDVHYVFSRQPAPLPLLALNSSVSGSGFCRTPPQASW